MVTATLSNFCTLFGTTHVLLLGHMDFTSDDDDNVNNNNDNNNNSNLDDDDHNNNINNNDRNIQIIMISNKTSIGFS